MTATLVPIVNVDALQSIEIKKTKFVFGRLPGSDHVFSDLRSSSRHAIIQHDPLNNTWTLHDNATNGTWINNKKIGKGNRIKLNNNDKIQFVRNRLEYKFIIQNIISVNNPSSVASLSLDPLADTQMPNINISSAPTRKRKQLWIDDNNAIKSENNNNNNNNDNSPPTKKRKLNMDDDIVPLKASHSFDIFDIINNNNINQELKQNNKNQKNDKNNRKTNDSANSNSLKKLKKSNPKNMRAADIRNLDILQESQLFDGIIALIIAKKSKRLDIIMRKFMENGGEIFDESDNNDLFELLKDINTIIVSSTIPLIKLKKKLNTNNINECLNKYHIVTLDWVSQSIINNKVLNTKLFIPKCINNNNNSINIQNINTLLTSNSNDNDNDYVPNDKEEADGDDDDDDGDGDEKEEEKQSELNDKKDLFITEHIEDKLLIIKHKNWKSSTKIAAFDLDGTVITTVSGNRFPKNYKDWKFIYDYNFVIKKKIEKYYLNNYCFVIFSNQKISHLKIKKPANYANKLNDIKLKIPLILKQMIIYNDKLKKNEIIPFVFIAALNDNIYRKPHYGMFNYFNKNLNGYQANQINKSSFFVGDAAGRAKGWKNGRGLQDFSNSDRCFASNTNLLFYTPQEFWLNAQKCVNYSQLNLKNIVSNKNNIKYPSELIELNSNPNKQEMIIFIGYPGCGKTTLYRRFFYGHNYKWINRDTLSSMEKCEVECDKYLNLKYSVVIDNTNPSKDSRKRFIKIAKRFQISIRCFWINIDSKLSYHLNVMRWRIDLNKTRQIKKIPVAAYKKYSKQFQKPHLIEGFTSIIQVPFVPSFDNEHLKAEFLLHT